MATAPSTMSLFKFFATTALSAGLTLRSKTIGIGIVVGATALTVLGLIYNICFRKNAQVHPTNNSRSQKGQEDELYNDTYVESDNSRQSDNDDLDVLANHEVKTPFLKNRKKGVEDTQSNKDNQDNTPAPEIKYTDGSFLSRIFGFGRTMNEKPQQTENSRS